MPTLAEPGRRQVRGKDASPPRNPDHRVVVARIHAATRRP
jgi:hypothetical protein